MFIILANAACATYAPSTAPSAKRSVSASPASIPYSTASLPAVPAVPALQCCPCTVLYNVPALHVRNDHQHSFSLQETPAVCSTSSSREVYCRPFSNHDVVLLSAGQRTGRAVCELATLRAGSYPRTSSVPIRNDCTSRNHAVASRQCWRRDSHHRGQRPCVATIPKCKRHDRISSP